MTQRAGSDRVHVSRRKSHRVYTFGRTTRDSQGWEIGTHGASVRERESVSVCHGRPSIERSGDDSHDASRIKTGE
jgi:hypothetical protein